MTIATEPPPPTSSVALHKALERIWTSGRGWQRLSAVNHTVIGKRFMLTAFVFFAIGGVLSMLIRAQLATPDAAFMGPEIYNQVFTMHGTVMMFLFAIPMLEGFAIYMLPKLLGARDLAFPRLGAYGYWCYLFGGIIIVVSMLFGVAPDSGWFMYTPLSSGAYSPGINSDIWLLGVTFVEISAVTAAVEIVVSILKLRAPGMSLVRMPIFAWYMLVTALMMVFGFPPLILGSILLELERAFDLPFFDPTRGGDSLLWQHLFWLFGHPEVYIIFLPAAGALSTIIPTFAQRPLVGYRAIVVAIVALGFLSFGLWVHHMFTVGIPHLALALFSIASALVAIPTAVQIFAWIATLAHGRPRFDVPMLYVFGFFVVFVIGGLTGVMLAMVPFDVQAHDSYFVVAHLHYVLVGGFVFPMLAGAYYWLPHVTGRETVHRISVPAFWLIFIGFNLTFFMMHITGLMGMPRRVYTYPDAAGWEWLNLLSSVGGFLLTIGFALFTADIALQLRFGRYFRRNLWRARTLEWAMPTRPTSYNFASIPHIDGRADEVDPDTIGPRLAGGSGYLGFARGEMETLVVEPVSGRLEQLLVLPRPSYWPLISALLTGGAVLSMLFKVYPLAAVFALATVASFYGWTRAMGSDRDHGAVPVGRGETMPSHLETRRSPVWLAQLFALCADGTLFASLAFGTLYLWLVAPNWPPPAVIDLGWTAWVLLPLLILPAITAYGADAAGSAGRSPLMLTVVTAAVQALAIAVLVGTAFALPDPTAHAHAATAFALLLFAIVHCGVGLAIAINGVIKIRRGHVSARRTLDLQVGTAWHAFSAATGTIAILLLLAMPVLIGALEPMP